MTTANHSPEATPTMTIPPALEQREIVITRVLDAPRDLVFKAWTDPQHLARWWGPHYFTIPVCTVDLRLGGALLVHVQGPDGVVYPMKGVFREIVVPERLVFSATAVMDEAGNLGLEAINTITFSERESKTELTVRIAVVCPKTSPADALAGMEEGWNESLDKLTELLAGN